MEKKDLVVSNLIRYFYAESRCDEIRLKIIALNQTMGVHSPNFSGEHGYTGTKDQKLLDYSVKKAKLDDELKGWENEKMVYYNVLHLNEIVDEDIKFLSLIYKDKIKYEEVAKRCFFTDKSYVSRKKETLLEKLSRYI